MIDSMPYLFTDTATINAHLGVSITSGFINITATPDPSNPEDYDEAQAILLENFCVRWITERLNVGWDIDETTPVGNVPNSIKDLVAQLTAALIGFDRQKVIIGRDAAMLWMLRLVSFVQGRLVSHLTLHDVTTLGTLTKKTLSMDAKVRAAQTAWDTTLFENYTRDVD